MRVDVKVSFTECDEAGDMEDAVGSEVVKLDAMQLEQISQEWVNRGRKTPLEVWGKHDTFIRLWGGSHVHL